MAPPSAPRGESKASVSPLENGAHLGASEFLRRYEAMPEIKKAELINGVVYMGSPVRLDQHGEPDGLVQTWLGTYAVATKGVGHATNTSVRLGPDDVPQPDGLLRLVPKCGGVSRVDEKGYLQGAPELVVEVAASSASLDAQEKVASYRRAGVKEYVVWRTEDGEIDWWFLEEDEYRRLPAGENGVLRSRVFPGLWLDATALLARDGAHLLSTLQHGLQTLEHRQFIEKLAKRSQESTLPGPPAEP